MKKLFVALWLLAVRECGGVVDPPVPRPFTRFGASSFQSLSWAPNNWSPPAWPKFLEQLPTPPWRRRGSSLQGVAAEFNRASIGGGGLSTERIIGACEAFLNVQRGMGPNIKVIADHFERNIKMAQRAYEMDPQARATVRGLLEDEVAKGHHNPPQGPLHSPSGACALLWMRRSIAFHAEMFDAFVSEAEAEAVAAEAAEAEAAEAEAAKTVASVGNHTGFEGGAKLPRGGKFVAPYPITDPHAPARAALLAYPKTLERYHNWMLQRAYRVGLYHSMPQTEPFLASLGRPAHVRRGPSALVEAEARFAEAVEAMAEAAAEATALAADALRAAAEADEAKADGSPAAKLRAAAAKEAARAAAHARRITVEATAAAEAEALARADSAARDARATLRDMRTLVEAWRPVVCEWEKCFLDLELEDDTKV